MISPPIYFTIPAFLQTTLAILFSHAPTDDNKDVINDEMTRLHDWADTWMIDLIPTKMKCMTITTGTNPAIPHHSFCGTPIELVTSHKHLGLAINSKMTWTDHIYHIILKTSKRIGILRSLKFRLHRNCLKTIYVSHIRSALEYCDVIWDNSNAEQALKLERLQLDCIRIITGITKYCSNENLYRESGSDTLSERRRQHRLVMIFKAVALNECPPYLLELLPNLRRDATVRNNRHYFTFEPYHIARNITFLHSILQKKNYRGMKYFKCWSQIGYQSTLFQNENQTLACQHFECPTEPEILKYHIYKDSKQL